MDFVHPYMYRDKPLIITLVQKTGLYLFPILTAAFIVIYLADETFYRELLQEDGIIEWLTFIFLIASGVLSAIIAVEIKQKHNCFHWFFILFFLFNVLAAFEEISWGQRVFGLEPGTFFQKNSDQNEINLHNAFQGIFHIKTKHIALAVLLVYGVVLPWMARKEKLNVKWLTNSQFILPPSFLTGGFMIAALLMLDFQTGSEEEIGELFFSMCFFLMMAWNLAIKDNMSIE